MLTHSVVANHLAIANRSVWPERPGKITICSGAGDCLQPFFRPGVSHLLGLEVLIEAKLRGRVRVAAVIYAEGSGVAWQLLDQRGTLPGQRKGAGKLCHGDQERAPPPDKEVRGVAQPSSQHRTSC